LRLAVRYRCVLLRALLGFFFVFLLQHFLIMKAINTQLKTCIYHKFYLKVLTTLRNYWFYSCFCIWKYFGFYSVLPWAYLTATLNSSKSKVPVSSLSDCSMYFLNSLSWKKETISIFQFQHSPTVLISIWNCLHKYLQARRSSWKL